MTWYTRVCYTSSGHAAELRPEPPEIPVRHASRHLQRRSRGRAVARGKRGREIGVLESHRTILSQASLLKGLSCLLLLSSRILYRSTTHRVSRRQEEQAQHILTGILTVCLIPISHGGAFATVLYVCLYVLYHILLVDFLFIWHTSQEATRRWQKHCQSFSK